jgi:hypothetical protein
MAELDAVQKMRMCLAEVGEDESAVEYPSPSQRERGVDVLLYARNGIDRKMLWRASQLVESNGKYVCWKCFTHVGDSLQSWVAVAEQCDAWRPMEDCSV